MLGADRRGPTARRGMTVLGKIPAVPKPINLPSQRLENRGLDPNVELVPRGSVTWGAGKSPPVSGSSNVWGSTSQSTVSSGPWGSGTAKPPQAAANSLWGPAPGGSAPTPPGAGSGPSIPVSRPSSAGSAVQASGTASAWGGQARPSSASTMPMQMQDAQPARPHSAEARAGGFYGPQSGSSGAQGAPVWEAQRPAEEPHHASKFQLTRGDFPSLGSEKDPDLRPQGQPAERPRSADERRSTSNTGFQDEGSSDMDYRGPRGMQDSWKRGNGAAPSDGPGGTYDTWRQGGPPSPDSWRREAGPPADSWRRDMRPSSAEARSEEWQGDGYGRDGPPPDSSRRREGGHGPGGAPPDTWRREGTSPSSGGIPPEHWRRDMPGGPGMLGPPFGPHPRFGGPAPGPYGGPGPGYGGFMRPDGYGPGMFRPGPMSDRRMRGPAFPGPPFDGYYGPPGRGPIRPGFGGADEREMGMMGPEGGVLGHRFPGPGGPARGYMGFGPDRFGRFGPAGPGGHIPGPYPGPGQRERPERDERGERERLEPPRASEPGVGREGGGRREGGRGEAHSEGLDGSSNDVSRQSRGSHHHGHHALGLDWASASEEAMDYSKPVFDDEPLSRSGGRQRSEDAPSASNLQDELPQTKGFTVPSVTETSESEKQNVADGSERQAENSQETDDSKNGASVKESVSSPQTTGKSMDTIRILKRAGDAGSQDSSPVGSPGPKEQQPVTSRGLQPAQAQGLAGMPESVPVPAPAASAPSTPAGDASGPAPPAPPMAPHVIQFGQIAHQDGLLNDIIRASAGVKIATVDSQGASTTQEAQSQQVSGVVSVPGSLVAATRISNKSASTLSKAPGAAGAGAASQSLPSMHGGTSRVSQGAPSGPLLENARTSISEEEGVVVAGSAAAVDYEAQRARMREIAEQRAQALKVQEEGRQKEQKAKAQAKLEELNRRVRGGAPTVSEGNVNAGVGVLQQAAASDIPPLLNADSGEGVKVAVAAPADGPGGGPVPAAGTVTRQQQQVATGAEQGSENRASSDSSEGGGPLRSDKEGGRKKSRSGRAGGGQSKKAARGPEGQQPESAAADAGGGQGRALAPKGVGTSATLPAGGAGGAPTSQGGGGGDGGVAGGDSGALGKEAGSQHAPPPPPRQRGSGERGRAPSSNAGSTGGGPAGSGARGQGPSREAGNDPAPVNSQTLQGPAEGDKGRGEPAKPSVAKKPLPPQRQRPPPRLPQDGRPADRGQQQHQQGPDGSSSRGAVAKASTNDAKAAAGETGVAAPLAAGAAKGQGQGQGQGPGDGQRQPRRVDAQHSTRQQVLPPPQQQQQQHAGPGGKKKADNQVGSTRPVPHLAQPQQQQQQQQQVPGGVAVAANEMAAGAHAQGGRSRRAEMERYSPKLALQQQQRQQQHPPGDGPAPPALPQGGLQNVTHGPHGTAGAPLPARSQPGGGRSFVQLGQQAGQAGGQQQLAAQQSSRQPSQQHAGPNHNHGTNQLPGDQQQQQGPGSAHWGAVPQGRPLHPAPGAKSIPPGAGGLAAATGHQPGVAPSRGAAAATSAAPDSQGGGGSTAERAQAPAVDVGAEGGARPGSAAHGGGGAGRRTSRGGAGASRGGRGGAPAHEQGGAAVGHQAGRGGGSAQAGSETGGQMAQEPRSATGRAVGGNLNALDGSGSRGGELVSREQHHHHQQQQVPGNPRPSAPGSQAQAQGQGGRHRPAAQGPHGNVAPAHQRPQGGPPAPGGGPTQAQRSNGPLSHVQSSNLNVRNASGGPAPSGPPPPARSLQTGVLGTPPVKDEKAVGQSAGTSGPRPSGAQGGVGAGRGTPDSRGKYQVINATGGAVPNPQAAS
eukprot:jgi/Mesen1/2922/ME000175S02078